MWVFGNSSDPILISNPFGKITTVNVWTYHSTKQTLLSWHYQTDNNTGEWHQYGTEHTEEVHSQICHHNLLDGTPTPEVLTFFSTTLESAFTSSLGIWRGRLNQRPPSTIIVAPLTYFPVYQIVPYIKWLIFLLAKRKMAKFSGEAKPFFFCHRVTLKPITHWETQINHWGLNWLLKRHEWT